MKDQFLKRVVLETTLTTEIGQEVPRRIYENKDIPSLINKISIHLCDGSMTMEDFDFCVAEVKNQFYQSAVIKNNQLK